MKLPNERTELGDKVRDVVTGFKGVVVARTEWLNGCVRVTVQPKMKKDGVCPEGAAFDEPQLEILQRANTPPEVKEQRLETGGPRPDVHRAAEPGR